MTDSDHNWIEYWAVFTDAGGIVQSNEYYSEWTARQFKRVMEQKLKAAGIHDAKLWIEHGRYDEKIYPNHRKNMNNWELPTGRPVSGDLMSAGKQSTTGQQTGVRVECYAGYRGEETPRRFHLGNKAEDVVEVLDRWLSPEHRYFKCLGADGGTYILRHDVQGDRWEITLYQRGNLDPNRVRPGG